MTRGAPGGGGAERGLPEAGSHAPDPVEERAREALARGDLEAVLETLMDGYGKALHRFCRRMVRDPDLADDVHQLTFVQAYESLGRFRGLSTMRAWLYGIARHRCLDALKTSGRRRARFELLAPPPETSDPAAGPDAGLEAESIHAVLEDCLGRLPAPVRAAIALRFEDELTYPEIAALCGDRPATLQARVARAMPDLKRCVEDHGVTL